MKFCVYVSLPGGAGRRFFKVLVACVRYRLVVSGVKGVCCAGVFE